MSTSYTPVLFFGRLFDSEEEVASFLKRHGTDYHYDSMESEDFLCLEYIAPMKSWALGFQLVPGTSDAYAQERWRHVFEDEEASAKNVVNSY